MSHFHFKAQYTLDTRRKLRRMEPAVAKNVSTLQPSNIKGVRADILTNIPICGNELNLNRIHRGTVQGPVHTGRRVPCNRRKQIVEHTVVNGSVHTACKQHQRVCTQICLRVLCEGGPRCNLSEGLDELLRRICCTVSLGGT